MKNVRRTLATAACVSLAVPVGLSLPNAAAAAPACNVVTDAKGDAKGPSGANNDPVLDIVSGDVATNAKKITGVVRVDKLNESSANYPYGLTWRIDFTIDDTTYFMSAISDRNGLLAQTGYTDPVSGSGTIAGAATVVLDKSKNEVRITSSVQNFANRVNIKPGMKLTAPAARTGAILSIPSVGNLRYPTVDTTDPGTTYQAGSASCVPVGK